MSQHNIEESFQIALPHHRAGNLSQAEAIYRQILLLEPSHVDALHHLGVIAHQAGRNGIAVDLIRRALVLRPRNAEAFSNLELVLNELGKADEAVEAYRRAVALRPGYAEAYSNLGDALRNMGQFDQASEAYGRAIALRPNQAEIHLRLGNALTANGQFQQAIAAYRQAIRLNPNLGKAHNNLANAMTETGQLEEAIAACHQALALKPNFPQALHNLGNALREADRAEEAVIACRQAVEMKPDYAEAYNNLGSALRFSGDLDGAIAAYRQAIALKPGFAYAYGNLGSSLRDRGQLDDAIVACRRAITLDPNFAGGYSNLGSALREKGQLDEAIVACGTAVSLKPNYHGACVNLGNALIDAGQLDEAIAAYREAIRLKPEDADAHSNLIFCLHFHPGCDARAIADELSLWRRQYAEPLKKFVVPHLNDRNPERRLRIGYVSSDFRNHPVGHFMLPFLACHDKTQVEIFAYSQSSVLDALAGRLRSYIDHWRSIVGLSDSRTVDLIRDDQIDILVDLTMHTANNRLLVFARKPAPVQVTWLAYPGTTGLTAIDYRLSDPYLDPPGTDESVYSERTIRLQDTFWCYDPVNGGPIPVNSLPALANRVITFASLNKFRKINDPVLSVWARILQAVPKSRLLLHAPPGSHRQRVLDRLHRDGIASERVRFADSAPPEDYFKLYWETDVALDPFPFGGGTTTCDAMWMGVPVVSLVGQTAVGRGGSSILSNVGLPELVAHSEEQYVQIVVELANDLGYLNKLRSTLRPAMERSPVMDARRFARNIQAAYREIWQIWCAK